MTGKRVLQNKGRAD